MEKWSMDLQDKIMKIHELNISKEDKEMLLDIAFDLDYSKHTNDQIEQIISYGYLTDEEKVEEMNESVKMIYAEDNNIIDITSKVFSNIINYIFGMIFLCLLIALVFSYLYGRNHDKSERYNILVNYISNKKIK